MGYGDVLRSSYQLPQNRYIGPQAPVPAAQPGAAPNLGLPDVNDKYANIQGTSDNFIDTVGQIERYALDMQKRYGIDVTQPDYAQPGGGQPFRTFQELTAAAIMRGNDLKQRSTEDTAINSGVLQGNVLGMGDYEQAPLGTPIQQRAVSVKLLPEVEQAARSLSQAYDTKDGAARATAAFKKPLVDKYTQLMNDDPQNAAFYQRQIDALPDAIYEPPQFAPSSTAAGKTEKREAIVDLYKRTTNLIKGAWEEGSFETTLDENFNPILRNTELSGTSLGTKDFVVKKQKKTYPLVVESVESKDGKMYINFVQPEEAQKDNFKIQPEEITGTKGDLFLKRLIEKNKGLGVNTTELVTALKEADLYSETGSKDEQVVRKDLLRTEPGSVKDVKQAVSSLKTIMSLSKGGEVLNTTLPNGQQVKVSKKSGLFGTSFDVSIDGTSDSMNMDEAITLLRESGYFNQYLKAPASAVSEKLPNETEGAYQLRILRAKQGKK